MKQTTNRSIITLEVLEVLFGWDHTFCENHWIYKLSCRFHCKGSRIKTSLIYGWLESLPVDGSEIRLRLPSWDGESTMIYGVLYERLSLGSGCLGFLPSIWGFPKMVVPNNHGFSYEKWSFWGVLRVPPFKETPLWIHKDFGWMKSDSALGFLFSLCSSTWNFEKNLTLDLR